MSFCNFLILVKLLTKNNKNILVDIVLFFVFVFGGICFLKIVNSVNC